jgi:hypothetical protein
MKLSTMNFTTYNKEQMEKLLEEQPDGRNTKFLNASHSLWFRFHNYDSNPPLVMMDGEEPVAAVFATLSHRSKYMNLYEIVTLEGKEGKGYASKIWSESMLRAHEMGMKRLKISCTPSSVTWHKRNGLVFWAVDPSGSLRSDQPLMPTREEQLELRKHALVDAEIVMPTDSKVLEQLKKESLESHKFGQKKTTTVLTAINDVGEYWMREALFKTPSLENFF